MKILDLYRRGRDAGKAPDISVNKLRRRLFAVEAELDLTRPKLSPEIADQIDYSSDEVVRLRDEYGLEFSGYDYARIERGDFAQAPTKTASFDDLVATDPDRRSERSSTP